jgi:hypothetical protein
MEKKNSRKKLPKIGNHKFERKRRLLLMNKKLKVILITPTSNTYANPTTNLFENLLVQSLKSL